MNIWNCFGGGEEKEEEYIEKDEEEEAEEEEEWELTKGCVSILLDDRTTDWQINRQDNKDIE